MKKIISMFMAGMLALSLASCSSGDNKAETKTEGASTTSVAEQNSNEDKKDKDNKEANKEKTKLNIAYMPNYASLWSVLTGIDKGYFEEEGLELNLIEFADGPSEIAAMEGGSVDLAYIGHGAHRLCITGSAQIIAPSSVHTTDKLMVLKSHGIEKLEDLKGKKIAYNAGSSSETALQRALEKAGLTMDDIEPYEMDPTNMVAAMSSGTIDACASWNPYDAQILKNSDDAMALEFATDAINLSSWIALPSYAKENKDIVLRFTRALFKSMTEGAKEENWQKAVELYAKQTGKDAESSFVETNDAKWFSADDIKKGLEDDTIKNYYVKQQEMFLEGGQIEEEVPVENYVLFDLIKEALN